MARFCTEKYLNPTPENFGNLYSHLTNYSLNKANNTYVHSRSLKEQLQGKYFKEFIYIKKVANVYYQLFYIKCKLKAYVHENCGMKLN